MNGAATITQANIALRAASDNNCAFTHNPLTPMKLYGIPNCDSVRKARNINKRSATYRAHKAEVLAAEAAGGDALIALLYALPTLIKRPVIVSDADVWLGLDARPLQAPRS